MVPNGQFPGLQTWFDPLGLIPHALEVAQELPSTTTDVQHPASRLMTRDKLMLDTDGPVADPLVKPVLCTGGRVRMGDIVLRCIVGRHRCGTRSEERRVGKECRTWWTQYQ